MDNRITGLLDLAEVLKDNPPATKYPDMPLRVSLDYPTLAEARRAAEEYGAAPELTDRTRFKAVRKFAEVSGQYFAGAELEIWWHK